jgi:hypothetical protein
MGGYLDQLIELPPYLLQLAGVFALTLHDLPDDLEVGVEQRLNDIVPGPPKYQQQNHHRQPEFFGHPEQEL